MPANPSSVTRTGDHDVGRPDARRLADAASHWRDRSTLLVLDPGLPDAIAHAVRDALHAAARVRSVSPGPGSPTEETVRPIRDAIAEDEPEVIVAVGGGATLDAAKIARSGVTAATTSRPRLVAVPTTAGTGAEATHFAVIYIDGVKKSIAGPEVRPDVAVIDPSLLASAPPMVAAAAALDALVQSIESLLSVRATDGSRTAARAALRRLAATLPDLDRHDDLGLAAFHAGVAIDVSFTGAAHALSYPFTARADVPHGIAVGRLLPWVVEALVEASDERLTHPDGPSAVRRFLREIAEAFGLAGPASLPRHLDGIADSVGVPRLPAIDTELVHAEAAPERLANTPLRFERATVDRVLARATSAGED